MSKRDIVLLFGTMLERFDTSLYSFLAPVMAPMFFPHCDPIVQLISVYATSVVALASRPLGTFCFGIYTRSFGPLASLSYSLVGVAVMTLLIGCIPSYTSIGWYAPALLMIVRFIRGFCAAGESMVTKLYIMEGKSDTHALKASYWYQSCALLGIMCASLLATIIISYSPQCWRLCFIGAGVLGFSVLLIRKNSFKNTEYSRQLYASFSVSHIRLLWQQKYKVCAVACATIFSHMTYAVPFVMMNSFVPLITDISLQTMMLVNSVLLIADMIAIPLVGRFTMRYKPLTVMVCAIVVLASTIVPLFVYLPFSSCAYVICMRIWIVFWGIVFLGPLNFWCKSLFNTQDQYFLVGMGNACGAATLGHATTPVCLWLWYVTGFTYAPAVYMMIIMVIIAGILSAVGTLSDK